MGIQRIICFLFLFIFMITEKPVHAQDLRTTLHEIMTNIYPEQAPGAALLVVRDGNIVINEGYGVIDLDSKSKISPATNFRMASVSKQFTAMSLLLLLKQKKISLDDTIDKYLTGLPSFAKKIQLKHLLTHSSGIADYESLIPEGTTSQVNDADVLEMIRHSDSLYFPPGSKFRYSNTGFCLITEIIKSVTGESYPEFIAKNIFRPLKMDHTTMMNGAAVISNRTYGYHEDQGTWKFADQSITSATLGDGCVYTSLEDYLKWMKALWSGALMDYSLVDPMAPHLQITKYVDYGFGWFTTTVNGVRRDFHSGESTGFHNIVFQIPQEKLLIAIFSNSDDDRIAGAFTGIAKALNVQWSDKAGNKSLFDYLHNIYE